MTTLPAWKTHRIAVTPLSPIHIGCGDDYDPTGFVLEPSENLLFTFDPSQATLTVQQKNDLLRCAKGNNALSLIYRFYQENKDKFKPFSKTIVPVDNATKKRIQSIPVKDTFTQNGIERTAYCRQQGAELPYIPGSSLKGVIHTALLDRLVKVYPRFNEKDLDSSILQGKMNKSPMRLLKVYDLLPTDNGIFTQIISFGRIKKTVQNPANIQVKKNGSFPFQPIEIVPMGQYRAFIGEIQLRASSGQEDEPNIKTTYQTPNLILRDLHKYCFNQFQENLNLWKKAKGDLSLYFPTYKPLIAKVDQWVYSIDKLLQGYETKFKEGSAALICLGKHTGGESKLLHDQFGNLINSSKKSKTAMIAKCPTTDTEGSLYLPFGWALIELDSQADVPLLKDWCAQNKFNFDLQGFREKFEVERRAETERKLALEAQKLEEEKKREEAQKAEEAKEKALKEMPENQRLATQLEETLQKVADAKPGSDANKQTVDLLNAAKAWDKADQRFLAQKVRPFVKKKKLDEGKSGKLIKSLLNTFEAS